MKTAKDVKARMVPGARLLCVDNTIRPEVNGTVRTIVKMGATVYSYTLEGLGKDPVSVWHGDWPPGVKVVDADSFLMPIGPLARKGRPEGTLILRFLP